MVGCGDVDAVAVFPVGHGVLPVSDGAVFVGSGVAAFVGGSADEQGAVVFPELGRLVGEAEVGFAGEKRPKEGKEQFHVVPVAFVEVSGEWHPDGRAVDGGNKLFVAIPYNGQVFPIRQGDFDFVAVGGVGMLSADRDGGLRGGRGGWRGGE